MLGNCWDCTVSIFWFWGVRWLSEKSISSCGLHAYWYLIWVCTSPLRLRRDTWYKALLSISQIRKSAWFSPRNEVDKAWVHCDIPRKRWLEWFPSTSPSDIFYWFPVICWVNFLADGWSDLKGVWFCHLLLIYQPSHFRSLSLIHLSLLASDKPGLRSLV